MRLDHYLVQQGLVQSRTRAQGLIKQGHVLVNETPCTKPALDITTQTVTLAVADHPYVSRAALKLEPFIEDMRPHVENTVALDLGASTGGFTQVLLELGASYVHAVDVGTNQLAPELAADERVNSLEQTDARNLSQNQLIPAPTLLVADLSFISLSKVLDHVLPTLKTLQHAFVLVKPQFELTPEQVGKKGIVESEKAKKEAVDKVAKCFKEHGWHVVKTAPSPVKGSGGNQEYLLAAQQLR